MPLYHRPELRPPLPTRGAKTVAPAQKFEPKSRDLGFAEISGVEDRVVRPNILMGAAGSLLFFSGCALTLFAASLMWSGPTRKWFWCGLSLTYLGFSFAAIRTLWRRLRSWIRFNEVQLRQKRAERSVDRELKPMYRERTRRMNDFHLLQMKQTGARNFLRPFDRL